MDTQQLLEVAQTINEVQSLFHNTPNEFLPVIAAIGGAFVGGVSTSFPTLFLESRKNRRERNSLTIALVSEISAILKIIQHRGYLTELIDAADHLKCNPSDNISFSVRIPTHYSRIYQSNIDRIGLVRPNLAIDIIEFHQLIDAVVQDITPDSPIQDEGFDKRTIEEIIIILKSAIIVGQKITGNHEQSYDHPAL